MPPLSWTKDALLGMVLDGHGRMIGLAFGDLSTRCCITTAPCGGGLAGRSSVHRGKQRLKRSVAAPAGRHDAPLLVLTPDAPRANDATMKGQLNRGVDTQATLQRLAVHRLEAEIAQWHCPAPITAVTCRVVERTMTRTNTHRKPVWSTDQPCRGPRVLAGAVGGGHRRGAADARGLAAVSLKWSPTSPTVTYGACSWGVVTARVA